jgi:hypothetical protein
MLSSEFFNLNRRHICLLKLRLQVARCYRFIPSFSIQLYDVNVAHNRLIKDVIMTLSLLNEC